MAKKSVRKHARKSTTAATTLAPLLYENGDGHRQTPTLQEIHTSRLQEDPQNARRSYDKGKLQELANSIATVGLIEPLVVRKADGVAYTITAGHRRLRAVRDLLRWDTVPCLVETGRTQAGAGAASAAENFHREDLTPFEQAVQFQRGLNEGLTQDQVARAYGVSETTVKNRLQLLRLPEALARKVGQDGFSSDHAKTLVPLADKPELLKEAAGAIQELKESHEWGTPIDAGDFAHTIARHLEAKKLAKQPPRAWELDELARHDKGLKAKLAKVPKIKVGEVVFYADVKAYNEATLKARQAKAAAEAKQRAKNRRSGTSYDYKLEEMTRQIERRLQGDAVVKATKGVLDLGTRETRLLLHLALHEARHREEEDLDALSRASGISPGDLKAIVNPAAKGHEKAIEDLLKARDQGPTHKLLVAAALSAVTADYAYGAEAGQQSRLLAAWGIDKVALARSARSEAGKQRKAEAKLAHDVKKGGTKGDSSVPKKDPADQESTAKNENVVRAPCAECGDLVEVRDGVVAPHRTLKGAKRGSSGRNCPGAGRAPEKVDVGERADDGLGPEPEEVEERERETPPEDAEEEEAEA